MRASCDRRAGAASIARAARRCFSGLLLASAAQAPLAASNPFVDEAVAGFDARSYYLDSEDNAKPPASTRKAAWAIGGKLQGRTGYWADTLQLGASYYLSLPLYAPDDQDGTLLLAPGQEAISVLGELYARLKWADHRLTLGRQEIDMAAPRARGVRAHRSDATYVGRLDNRMVPVTYEAALLGGHYQDRVRYHAGWIGKAKLRNAEDFSDTGTAIGAKGSDAALWLAGLQFAPIKDLWLQGWYHQASDVIRIGFVDADYVARLSNHRHLRLAGQYTDQRSDGSNALTGQAFTTHNTQVYGEVGLDWLNFYGAWSRTRGGADMRFPFSSGPIYTAQVVRTFTRAGESAWQLGIGTQLGACDPGLAAFADVTSGQHAVDPSTGTALGDEQEINVGAALDGLRYAWVTDQTSVGEQRSTDLRIDLNLPFNLR